MAPSTIMSPSRCMLNMENSQAKQARMKVAKCNPTRQVAQRCGGAKLAGSRASFGAFHVAQRSRSASVHSRSALTCFAAEGPLKVIIAGAPASGKGTQCEKIVEKYNLVHISAGDLLRAAVAEGTDAGKTAKEYMDNGQLVPNEVVVTMVKDRLAQDDAQTTGFLLDGYPRSGDQAEALKEAGIDVELFILLNVPDELLVERVVGRRSDPETGKIYHMKYFPPESEEIKARLIQRSDDNEEACKKRLTVYHTNIDAVTDYYPGLIKEIDGTQSKDEVFGEIDTLLAGLRE